MRLGESFVKKTDDLTIHGCYLLRCYSVNILVNIIRYFIHSPFEVEKKQVSASSVFQLPSVFCRVGFLLRILRLPVVCQIQKPKSTSLGLTGTCAKKFGIYRTNFLKKCRIPHSTAIKSDQIFKPHNSEFSFEFSFESSLH